MLERLSAFMGAEEFMPHGHCYFWLPEILWLHVVSDALIVASYYSIPLGMLYFAYKRRQIPFPKLFYLFSAFIFLCGTTHIMEIVVVWNPYYGLEGLSKAATALVSLATAYYGWKILPIAMQLKTPMELEEINRKLQTAYSDIERKVEERTGELAESLTEYEVTVNTVIDGLIVIDERGIIQKVNPSVLRMFGYRQDELIGRNVHVLMPEPYHSQHDGYLRNYMDSGKAKVIGIGREVAAKRKDGTVFPIELGVSEMQLRGRRMFVGMIHDITERKQAEERLREREIYLDTIIENIPSMVFVKESEGLRFVRFNKAGEALTGLTREQVLGKNDYDFFPREQADAFSSKDRQVLAQNKPEIIQEEPIDTVNGKRILFTKKTAVELPNGQRFLLGISDDITERKHEESYRQQLLEKLTRSNTELERFAYVASHDMQEPIRMITNFSSIIANDYGAALDEKGREYLRLVMDAGTRVYEMVEDLLAYSRVDSEGVKLVQFNGASVLASVLENLKELIKERQVSVTHDTLPAMYGNPVQFMRLMQNLITNAIKYQPEGNIPEIHVSVEDQAPYWRISIKDNGMGIKEGFLEQIFQPFRRLHTWENIRGTGLGLSICKKIVENHGGSIGVRSTPGEGSVFYFTLLQKPQTEQEAI